jgi:hypothetical protein
MAVVNGLKRGFQSTVCLNCTFSGGESTMFTPKLHFAALGRHYQQHLHHLVTYMASSHTLMVLYRHHLSAKSNSPRKEIAEYRHQTTVFPGSCWVMTALSNYEHMFESVLILCMLSFSIDDIKATLQLCGYYEH